MISMLTEETVVESGAAAELTIRKAVMHDIGPILRLINGYAAKGIMLPRTEFEMSENIRDFSVVLHGDQLLGCGALHFYSPTMAEIRSLAVDEAWKTHGVGRRLIEALVEEGIRYELDAVFAFTYVAGFFEKMDFERVERGLLPLKAWKDCLRCPKFERCDEIAMVRVLRPEHWATSHGEFASNNELIAESGYIQLPILPA
jgi:amino-acid N-acetyltransferase